MAAKLLRLGWERQPVGPVGINWGHPRAEGLAFFAPLSAAHGTRDLVAEQLGTRTGLEAYLPSQAGAIHHLFGTSNFVDFPTVPSAIGSTTPFTVAWTQEPRSTTGYATPLLVNFGSGTNQFVIYQAASDASYAFVVGPRAGGNSPSFSSSIGLQVNERLDRYVLQALAGSQSLLPADYVLWRNGVRFTTASTVALGLLTAAIFRIGARDAGSDSFEGLIGDLRMWSRVLSDGEAEAESTLPEAYALYAPQRIWVPVAAAASSLNVTQTTGASVSGSISATGDIQIASSLNVSQTTGASVSGSLSTTGNIQIGTSFNVAQTTGAAVSGSLSTTGNIQSAAATNLVQSVGASVSGALAITGDLQFGIDFGVTQTTGASVSGSLSTTGDVQYGVGFDLSQVVGPALAGVLSVTGDIASSTSSGASAADVWAYEIETGVTALQAMRIVLAAVSGKTTGLGTSREVYYAPDGVTPRITVDFDASSNRTTVQLNG